MDKNIGKKTKLTIAICTYRRYKELYKCLELLNNHKSVNKFKVIVIDNSAYRQESLDFKIGLSWFEKDLKYIITPKSGLSYARNIALLHVDTPIVAYLDDDAYIRDGWVDNLIESFADDDVAIVGGEVNPIWEIQKPDWLNGDLLHPLAILNYKKKNFELDIENNEWLVGANIAYKTKVLLNVGGFDENLGRKKDLLLCHEELAVNRNIKKLGYKIIYVGDVVVDHIVQKERIDQRWFCKNAFWEMISHKIFMEGIDSTSFKKEDIVELHNYFDSIMFDFTERQTSAELIAFLNDIKKKASEKINILHKLIKTKKNSFVYIVTPSYNSEQYIEKTILSVLNQQGEFYLKYHIQDGASNDRTLSILKKWQSKIECGEFENENCNGIVFTFMSEEDDGMYDGISKGFENQLISKNSVMGWINADDILVQGALSISVQALLNKDINWITGIQNVIDQAGNTLFFSHHPYPQELIVEGLCDGFHWAHIQQEGTFWKKWLWDKVDGLDINMKLIGDWNLWVKFSKVTSLVQIPIPLAAFRSHDSQLSSGDVYNEELNEKTPIEGRSQLFRKLLNAKSSFTYFMIDWKEQEVVWRRCYLNEVDCFPSAAIQNKALFLSAGRNKDENREDDKMVIIRKKASVVDRVRNRYHRIKDSKLIKNSGIFINNYYLANNPDVKEAGIDPIKHYLLFGYKEGRDPGPLFNESYYQTANPDVVNAGMNSLIHFLKYGWKEGRNPNANFSIKEYILKNPDVEKASINPLTHYLRHGVLEDRKIR